MKRKINVIELKSINLEHTSIVAEMFDVSVDRTKINKALNRNVTEEYKERKTRIKEDIINALNECDDFAFDFEADSYFGDETFLRTYKIEVETDEELEIRKKKASESAKKSAAKRKIAKEKKEREDYEKLKAKFEND